MSHQLDGQRRERDFQAATHAVHWHRAEQLAAFVFWSGYLFPGSAASR